ncbi:hypothetical protein [Cohnella thailandensis]|uniref:Peptidase A2 domain-containing protein n=1 Tax=Cohnella thailandensis TaxID=557557 RepID=A0A841T2B7_9BACL|nr:hypothetical protein [Cohnella thailandensis]MBB6638294.1 hypothetical protein [Cohnella thailandensis]MBP1977227.1 hypothetical protein [Cohnella thailandensis]
MKIQMHSGLPTVSINLKYKSGSIKLEHVLIDTGCLISIFDTDLVDSTGLYIQSGNGSAVRMYGVGGKSEVCYQQSVSDLYIDDYQLNDFEIQLGMTRIPYGFDAILGIDFFSKFNLKLDFDSYSIY